MSNPTAAIDLLLSFHHDSDNQYRVTAHMQRPDSDAPVDLLDGLPAVVLIDLDVAVSLLNDSIAYGEWLGSNITKVASLNEAIVIALTTAETQQIPLRLRLALAPQLQGLQWEALRLPRVETVATSERILLSRHLTSSDTRPLRDTRAELLRTVVAIANPKDIDRYKLATVPSDQMLADARLNLEGTDIVPADANLDKLDDALRAGCDVLYLACHGVFRRGDVNDAYLLLGADDEDTVRVKAADFRALFKELAETPRLVVLISCQSAGNMQIGEQIDPLTALGPMLIEAGVPAVIAMQGNVTMKSANEFLRVFFAELLVDGVIDRALAVARRAIKDRPDVWAPVLYMRLATGRLWQSTTTTDITDNTFTIQQTDYQQSLFVDRDVQIKGFNGVLKTGDQFVGMHVVAEPGMGKSWFLRRLKDVCLEAETRTLPVVHLDLATARDIQDFLSLIRYLRNALGYQALFANLNHTINQRVTGPVDSLIEQMSSAFTPAELTELYQQRLDPDNQHPLDPGSMTKRSTWIVTRFQKERALPTLLTILSDVRPNYLWEFGDQILASDDATYDRAVSAITRAFFDALETLLKEVTGIVFLFDSYNHRLAAPDAQRWIQTRLMDWLRTEPADGAIVVVTEEARDDREPTQFRMGARLVDTHMGPLTDEDIKTYLNLRGLSNITATELEDALKRGRRPAVLATIADTLDEKGQASFWDSLG